MRELKLRIMTSNKDGLRMSLLLFFEIARLWTYRTIIPQIRCIMNIFDMTREMIEVGPPTSIWEHLRIVYTWKLMCVVVSRL
jgi:hypothetical protein